MSDNLGCKACSEADENPLTATYGTACGHCAARALAQSPEFFASSQGDTLTLEYSAALRRIYGPDRAIRAAAHQSVKAWAKVIRDAKAAKATAGNPPFDAATQEGS